MRLPPSRIWHSRANWRISCKYRPDSRELLDRSDLPPHRRLQAGAEAPRRPRRPRLLSDPSVGDPRPHRQRALRRAKSGNAPAATARWPGCWSKPVTRCSPSDLYPPRPWRARRRLPGLERRTDNIVTNPPYNCAEAFVAQGLKLARRKFALLLRLAFLEGANRAEHDLPETPARPRLGLRRTHHVLHEGRRACGQRHHRLRLVRMGQRRSRPARNCAG